MVPIRIRGRARIVDPNIRRIAVEFKLRVRLNRIPHVDGEMASAVAVVRVGPMPVGPPGVGREVSNRTCPIFPPWPVVKVSENRTRRSRGQIRVRIPRPSSAWG